MCHIVTIKDAPDVLNQVSSLAELFPYTDVTLNEYAMFWDSVQETIVIQSNAVAHFWKTITLKLKICSLVPKDVFWQIDMRARFSANLSVLLPQAAAPLTIKWDSQPLKLSKTTPYNTFKIFINFTYIYTGKRAGVSTDGK